MEGEKKAPGRVGGRKGGGKRERELRVFRNLRRMKKVAVLLWPYLAGYKGFVVLGIALTVCLIGLRLVQPWPLKWLVDRFAEGKGVGRRSFGGEVALLSVLYIAFSVSASFVEYVQRLLLAGVGNRVLAGFRLDLFSRVLRQPLSFHERREIGELVTRIVYDTSRLRRGVRNILTRTFQTAFLFVAKTTVLFFIDPSLALVLAAAGGAALVLMGRGGGRIYTAARKQRKSEGKLASVVAESVSGIRELQAFCPADMVDDRFLRQNAKSLKAEQKVRRLAEGLLLRVNLLLAFSICGILWWGGMKVQRGDLSVGDLVVFFSYATGLSGPFRRFARQTALTGRTLACADRLVKMMEKEPSVRDLPGAVSIDSVRGDIVFEGVSYRAARRRRGGRKWILRDVSFSVKAGERVAVVGPNGAGKSSLIKLLLRLVDPHEGRICVDGRDLREYTLESLRRQMNTVFQENVFFGLTVRENIAIGCGDVTDVEIQEAARRAGVLEMIGRLKKGMDTPVYRQGRLFSGGERQRIAIARALLQGGNIWLLDEPTSALDAEAADEIINLLLEVTEGHTTFWITHDLRLLSFVDKILFLENGRISFEGTPQRFEEWLSLRERMRLS